MDIRDVAIKHIHRDLNFKAHDLAIHKYYNLGELYLIQFLRYISHAEF